MGKNGAHLLVRQPGGHQRLLRVLQMLVRVLLIVVVVQVANGHPVGLVLAEMSGKTAHGGHDIFGMEEQMLLGGGRGQQFLCALQCKHNDLSFDLFFVLYGIFSHPSTADPQKSTETGPAGSLSRRAVHLFIRLFYPMGRRISPQAILSPEFPDGWVVKSSGFAWITTARPITSSTVKRFVNTDRYA